MEYPTSRHDVYHVAFLLRQKLVADLVPIILDEAQYWTRRRVATDASRVVSDAPEGKRLLQSAPLTAEEHRRVRLVRFTTKSVAQCFDRSVWDRPQSPGCGSITCSGGSGSGFSWEAQGSDWQPKPAVQEHERDGKDASKHDTTSTIAASTSPATPARDAKDDAFTWFEAHVGKCGAPDHLYPDTSSRHPGTMRIGAPRAEGQAPWNGPRLLANCNSEEELCTYEAEWRFDSEDRDERLRVRRIAEGDTVDFTAHCSVFGWENYVKNVEIEIFFGHVR